MKNIKYFLAVITVFLLVLSCQDEEQFFEDSPDDSFTIEEARKWFESNHFPIMELTSSESEVFLNKSNNNEFKKRIKVLFQNQWKYAFKTKKKHIEAIEVPLKSNGWFSYSDKNSWDKWKQNKNYGYIRSITRLVIVNDREKETIKTFFMTIKGSSVYLERNNFRYGPNTYLKKEKDFEGMIFFHSLDGDFINGWQLYNGLIIGKISENIYSSKSIARKSDYTCTTYDVYANYETCSYAHTGYEENEEGALEAVWEFRGCETSEVWVDRFDVCEYNDEGEPVIDENYLEGGSGDNTQQTEKFKTENLDNTQIQLLQNAIADLENDCIGRALVNFINSVNFNMGISTPGVLGAYDPHTNTIFFDTNDAIGASILGGELFHAFQQQLYGDLDEIQDDPQHVGASNMEFEEKVFNTKRDLDAGNLRGVWPGEDGIHTWLAEMESKYPNGLESLNQTDLNTWFDALETFQQYHSDKNNLMYGAPINYNRGPNAFIILFNEIKNSNCQ